MDVGDEQIYRLHDYAPSQRVRIVAIDGRKKNPRYEIEFLDGGKGARRRMSRVSVFAARGLVRQSTASSWPTGNAWPEPN